MQAWSHWRRPFRPFVQDRVRGCLLKFKTRTLSMLRHLAFLLPLVGFRPSAARAAERVDLPGARFAVLRMAAPLASASSPLLVPASPIASRAVAARPLAALRAIPARIMLERPALSNELELRSFFSGEAPASTIEADGASAGSVLAADEPGPAVPAPLKKIIQLAVLKALPPVYSGRAQIYAVAFSPDGKTLFAGGMGPEIVQLDVRGGKVARRLTLKEAESSSDWTQSLRLSRDGGLLLSAGPGPGAVLWSTRTGKAVRRFESLDNLWDVAFSADERLVYGVKMLGGGDETEAIVEWDVETGVPRASYSGYSHLHLALSPDGRRLAASGNGRPGRLWDAETGRPIQELELGVQDGRAHYNASGAGDVYFIDGGRRLLGVASHAMGLWDIEGLAPAWSRVSPESRQYRMVSALSSDRRRLLTGTNEGKIAVIDVETGAELLSGGIHGNILSIAFHPDGRRAAVGLEDGTVRLLELPPLPRPAVSPRALVEAKSALARTLHSVPGIEGVEPDADGGGLTVRFESESALEKAWKVIADLRDVEGVPIRFAPEARATALALVASHGAVSMERARIIDRVPALTMLAFMSFLTGMPAVVLAAWGLLAGALLRARLLSRSAERPLLPPSE